MRVLVCLHQNSISQCSAPAAHRLRHVSALESTQGEAGSANRKRSCSTQTVRGHVPLPLTKSAAQGHTLALTTKNPNSDSDGEYIMC